MANLPEGFEIVSQPQATGLPEGFEVVSEDGRSFTDQLGGALDVAATMGSGIIAEPISGLAGIAGAILPGEEGQGAEWVEKTQQALTRTPSSEAGKEYLQDVGKVLEPVAEGLSTAERFLGEATLEATGSPELAAIAHTLPTAALEALGVVGAVKAGKPAMKASRRAAETAAETATKTAKSFESKADQLFKYQSPYKKALADKIKAGSTDDELARFRVGDTGKLQKDPVAREAIKQGFDEGVLSPIKQAGRTDKDAMLKMVDIMEKGKKNKRFAELNRPSDVAGETLIERVNTIKFANKSAGKQLDSVAKELKGQGVDTMPAVNNFIESLDEMGVSFDSNMKPDFKGSDIEGVVGAERIVNQMIGRMKGTGTPDAYDTHRMKKFIDEQVTYGKGAEGLAGKTERVMKKLRKDLDSALDSKFPAYDEVNTTYAETIGALDALQDVAGKKMNLSGPNANKAVGTLLRRLSSNAQSRVTLLDAITEIEAVSKKHAGMGKKLLPGEGGKDADLISQVLFMDELDSVFGPVARTSLKGQVEQGIKSAGQGARGGAIDIAIEALGKGAEKARGINDEAAFKAIKELLKQ